MPDTTGPQPTDPLQPEEVVRNFASGQLVMNRYRLDRVLGQGGMGVVWLARDEELEREVALKFLPSLVIKDRASLNDLKRETRRSLELTHPNIVRTYDFVQDATTAGISMEYVDSDTLRNLRLDQPSGVFQPPQIGEWTRQLCSALDYAHLHASIVHRDLKPANLMVNKRGQLKVADFGIARSLVESVSQITMRSSISGTLVYMSPQQLGGETASPADDLYAIGATLFELLTTRPPFYHGDISSQIQHKAPPTMAERRASLGLPVGEIPQIWETTVAQCLAKDPEQRPRTAGEIAARLGLVDASSVTVRAPITRPAAPPIPATATRPGPATGTFSTNGPSTEVTIRAPKPFFTKKTMAVLGVLAAALGFFVIVAALAAFYFLGGGNASPSASPAPLAGQPAKKAGAAPVVPIGTLLVKTDPPGATLSLAGLPPQKSPASFRNVPVGHQTIQISAPGYAFLSVPIVIEANQVADLGTVSLQRSKGGLDVQSTPAGLAYELKSAANPLESTRGTLPLHATALPTGDYELTVTRDFWPTQKQRLTVRDGEMQQASFDLTGGSVTINSEPPGAKVQFNGKALGVTPLRLDDVPPGNVHYALQLPGYEEAVTDGLVSPGQPLELTLPMKKIPVTPRPRTVSTTPSHSSTSSSKPKTSSSSHSHDDDSDGPSVGRRMKDGFTDRFIRGGFGF